MKIAREKYDAFYKIVKNWPVYPILKKSYIFFPILEREIKEEGGLELVVNNTKEAGSRHMATPGFVLLPKGDEKEKSIRFGLAYGDIRFSPTFDFLQYLDLYGVKLSKKELEDIKELDCYLVIEDNIFEIFEY